MVGKFKVNRKVGESKQEFLCRSWIESQLYVGKHWKRVLARSLLIAISTLSFTANIDAYNHTKRELNKGRQRQEIEEFIRENNPHQIEYLTRPGRYLSYYLMEGGKR